MFLYACMVHAKERDVFYLFSFAKYHRLLVRDYVYYISGAPTRGKIDLFVHVTWS